MAFKNLKNMPGKTRFARNAKPQFPGPARTITPIYKGKQSPHKTPVYNTFPPADPKPWELKRMSRDDYYRDLARKRKLDDDQAKNRLNNQMQRQQLIQDKYLNNDDYELIEEDSKGQKDVKRRDEPKDTTARSGDEFLTEETMEALKPQKIYVVKKDKPRERPGAIFRQRQTYDKPRLAERYFGQDVIYGTHAVEAALTSHKRRNQCLKVFTLINGKGDHVTNKIVAMATKLRIAHEQVDRNTLNLITSHAIHNGVALVTKPLELDEILELEEFTKAHIGQTVFVKTMRHGVMISEPASYLFSEEEKMGSLEEVKEDVETVAAKEGVAELIIDDATVESSVPKTEIASDDSNAAVADKTAAETESAQLGEAADQVSSGSDKATVFESGSLVVETETVEHESNPEYESPETIKESEEAPKAPHFQVTSSVQSHRPRRFPLVVYLDQLNDTHNLGSILRSSQFLGVDAVVVTAKNCAPLSPAVAKTSSGALEFMPIFENGKTPQSFFAKCRANGWTVLCAHVPSVDGTAKSAQKPLNFNQMNSLLDDKPTILVLGGEHGGVRTSILQQCDNHVIIPAHNRWIKNNTVDSLNVGVAASILINRLVG